MFRLIGFIAATIAFSVHAQPAGTTPNPNQPLIDAKDRLEAQTNLLKAETALLQAKIGTIPTGKEGSITVGTVAYPIGAVERVYERLKPLAKDVCTAVASVQGADGAKVLVGPADLLAVARYRMVDGELQLIEQDAKKEAKDLGLASIGVILGAVESISKLFRSDLAIVSENTSVDPRYLQDLVSACLTGTVSYPALAAQQALLLPTSSNFFQRVIELVRHRSKIKDAHAKAVADKDIAKAAQLDALLGRLDKFVTALVAIPDAQKQHPPLIEVLLGEAVASVVNTDLPPVILVVNLVNQGGLSMLEKRSFFSDRLYVGGGAIATYRITKGDRLLASGMVAQVDPEMKRVYLK